MPERVDIKLGRVRFAGEPSVIKAPTLATLLKLQVGGKLKKVDLAGFLATAQFDPTYRGPNNTVMLPLVLVPMIGPRLISKSQWDELKTTRAVRSQKTADRHAEVLVLVEKTRRQYPHLASSDNAIAQRVARHSDYAPRTIRGIMARQRK